MDSLDTVIASNNGNIRRGPDNPMALFPKSQLKRTLPNMEMESRTNTIVPSPKQERIGGACFYDVTNQEVAVYVSFHSRFHMTRRKLSKR